MKFVDDRILVPEGVGSAPGFGHIRIVNRIDLTMRVVSTCYATFLTCYAAFHKREARTASRAESMSIKHFPSWCFEQTLNISGLGDNRCVLEALEHFRTYPPPQS